MRHVLILFLHLIVTVVRLARPGGLGSVVAESLLQPPAPAETNEKLAEPCESKPDAIEPVRDFIDTICGEGRNKPSAKTLGKLHCMG